MNRLPGVAWLAYAAGGRNFDAAFNVDVRTFFRDVYHLELTDPQLRKLLTSP